MSDREANKEWILCGQLSGTSDTGHRIERIRTLAESELEQMNVAEDVLNSITSGSPHQRLAGLYQLVAQTNDDLLEDAIEGIDQRQQRAISSLSSWLAMVGELPGEYMSLASAVLDRDGLTEFREHLEYLKTAEPLKACAAILHARWTIEKRGTRAMLSFLHEQPNIPGNAIFVAGLVNQVMAISERTMARLIVGASPTIQRCSASIRRIESEVLFGTPCLAQFQEGKIRIREFPSAAVVFAQQALRISAALLHQEGSASSQPIPPPPPPGDAPHAEPSGPPPKRRDNTVSTSSSAGQDLPKPPIDFDAVVNHLVGEAGAIEEAWVSALVATQDLTKKAVADVSRYMVLAKLSSEDAGEESSETTVTKFPLSAEEIALLKPGQSISDNPGHIFLPELYVIRDIIDMLTAMNPSQGRGASLSSSTPFALESAIRLLQRCRRQRHITQETQLSGSTVPRNPLTMLDASLEAAYVAGLPEAVILYAHMAPSDDHDRYSDLRPVIEETVRHMIHEGNAHDLLPISIPLAEEIIKRSTS